MTPKATQFEWERGVRSNIAPARRIVHTPWVMPSPRLKIASLDDATLEKVRLLEQEFGATILALEPHYPVAPLKPDQVKRLEALENELGVVLLAYTRD